MFTVALSILPSYIVIMILDVLSVSPRSRLYRGDCLDVLQTLPDNSIDCILTDPPYGYNYVSRSHKLPLTKIANDRHEAIPLLRKALVAVYPKLKPNGVGLIFTNWQCYASMAAAIEEEGYEIKNLLIWEKNAWSRGDLKGNWGYSYEMVMYFKKQTTPSKLRRFLRGKREGNILKFKKLPTNAMQHPTEKPVELLKYLLEKTTEPGDAVLDPFAGSGSTIVAAQETGRICLGAEIEPEWARVAAERTGLPLIEVAQERLETSAA
jgi:site-specific DNA-methyltransferase (adenine-specific)